MIIRFLRLTYFTYILTNLLVVNGYAEFQSESNVICSSASLPVTTPWDLVELSKSPEYEWADREDSVWSLYYPGQDYKGNATRVFAYYASPATMDPNYPEDSMFPAVVLVHGGGGTAFKEWVELWANRGYAAIAMDLAGCGPKGKRLSDGGPNQTHDAKFGSIDSPVKDQWAYHGVANVILAHSLIRSFKEVNADRTAVTGISWGGYLTCIVAGLDSRFKAAVPVYGCGFLSENSAWLNRFSEMTPQQKDKWIQLWDPSKYIGSAVMPVFFVHGTNDSFYPLDSYSKTYGLVESERNFRITIDMTHGHQQGWSPMEIGIFVDQYLKGGVPLPIILRPELLNDEIHAKIKSETALVDAHLYYTTGTKPINRLEWESMPARFDGKELILSAVPEKSTICFFTVTDNRGATVSSELIFLEK